MLPQVSYSPPGPPSQPTIIMIQNGLAVLICGDTVGFGSDAVVDDRSITGVEWEHAEDEHAVYLP